MIPASLMSMISPNAVPAAMPSRSLFPGGLQGLLGLPDYNNSCRSNSACSPCSRNRPACSRIGRRIVNRSGPGQGMNRMPWTFGAYDQIPQDRDAMMKMFFPGWGATRRPRKPKRRSKRFCRP